jgi:hypothetical protein
MTSSRYADPRQRTALPVGNLFSDIAESKSPENCNQKLPSSIQTQTGKGVRYAH